MVCKEQLKTVLVVFLLFVSCPMLMAQQEEFSTDIDPTPFHINFNELHGLPSNEVYEVYQDKLGYLWFATDNGVSRYDGSNFQTFSRRDGLTDEVVFGFFEDDKGQLWCETFNNKLCYINTHTLKITPYKHNAVITEHLKARRYVINSITVLENGNVCIATFGTGLFTIDSSGALLQPPRPSKKSGWGVILSATPSTFCYPVLSPKLDLAVLHVYEPDQFNDFSAINTPSYSYKIIPRKGNYKLSACRLDSNTFAIGVQNTIIVGQKEGAQGRMSFPSGVISINSYDSILWVGTHNNGVFGLRVKEDLSFQTLLHFFPDLSITEMCKDFQGGYWFTSREAGVLYVPDINARGYKISKSNYSCMARNDQYLFLGRDDGVIDVLTLDLSHLPAKSLKINYSISDILLSPYKNALIFSTSGGGTFSLDLDSWKMSRINKSGYKILGFLNDSTLCLGPNPVTVRNLRSNDFYEIKLSKKVRASSSTKGGLLYWIQEQILLHRSATNEIEVIENLDMPPGALLAVGEDSLLAVSKIGDFYWRINGDTGFVPNGGYMQRVNHVVQAGDLLYFSGTHGLCTLPIETAMHSSREVVEIYPEPLIDFRLEEEHAFCLTKKGVTKINLDEPRQYPIPIRFTSITVNGALVDHRVPLNLAYNKNNLRVNFQAIVLDPRIRPTYDCFLIQEDTLHFQTETTTSANFVNLGPGDYHLYVTTSDNLGNTYRSEQVHFSIALPFWQSPVFLTGLAFLVVLAILGIFHRLNKKNEFEQLIGSLKSQALRAQMNPHFIFNSMNTLVGMITEGETNKSIGFISRFSKLIREILEISELDAISLEREIAFCKNYFLAEQTRFDGNIELQVHLDLHAPGDNFWVPPLILQPLIENAIHHGLLPVRDRPGVIHLFARADQNILSLKVVDNGIGYQKTPSQNSKGLQLVRDRIKLHNKRNTLTVNRGDDSSNDFATVAEITLHYDQH